MSKEEIHLNLTREWALREAKREPADGDLAVGGLALQAASIRAAQQELRRSPVGASVGSFFKRLADIGLGKEFVLQRLVGQATAAAFVLDTGEAFERLAVDVLQKVNHVFQWTPSLLLSSEIPPVAANVIGQARFKVTGRADERHVSVYAFYAHYLALLLLKATEDLPPRPIPSDPETVLAAIQQAYGEVTLHSALHFCWDLALPVLPLNDPAAFHGAFWRVGGRNVIVLKQRTGSLARWLFDLLHELWHAAEEPSLSERSVIEFPEISEERRQSDEEQDASWFAGEVILHGHAEDLVKRCVQLTKGKIPLLKSTVPQVAAAAGVGADALANYLAFRLSLQGEDWWGTAVNLQPKGQNPWHVARDVLRERTNLSRLSGLDRDLLEQALEDPAELLMSE